MQNLYLNKKYFLLIFLFYCANSQSLYAKNKDFISEKEPFINNPDSQLDEVTNNNSGSKPFLSNKSKNTNFTYSKEEILTSKSEEFDILPTEDLMREHGLLSRLLLIYEEIIKRIDTKTDFPLSALDKASGIIKSFIEDYHEKLEENYIFPLFEKRKNFANKTGVNTLEAQLVKTLREQHNKGREITAKLRAIISGEKSINKSDKQIIKNLLKKTINMYRPHAAREDTVLFPKIRSLVSAKEFDVLGDKFEDLEHKLFGQNGFESMVGTVAGIEKELGIYKLDKFTPKSI